VRLSFREGAAKTPFLCGYFAVHVRLSRRNLQFEKSGKSIEEILDLLK
jgi:hypothetical protein